MTEETDAVVVVVSEERGTISVCFSGNIIRDLDALNVRKALLGLFQKKKQKGKDRPTGRGGKADRSGNDISLGGVPLPSMGQHTSGPHSATGAPASSPSDPSQVGKSQSDAVPLPVRPSSEGITVKVPALKEDLPVDGDTHKLPAIRDAEVPAVASPAGRTAMAGSASATWRERPMANLAMIRAASSSKI